MTLDNLFFLKSEPKMSKSGKIYDILNIRDTIGPDACKLLLFAHAFTGCDTTPKPYGLGKSKALKLVYKNEVFKNLANQFVIPNHTIEHIDAFRERAMILLYGGDSTDAQLDLFRYRIFQQKVAVASVAVQPEDIPPTSAAVKFQGRRTYHQVCVNIIHIFASQYVQRYVEQIHTTHSLLFRFKAGLEMTQLMRCSGVGN